MRTVDEIIDELRIYDSEREWFEFKTNKFDPKDIGEYISALSNSAAFEGRKKAYLVWGINDANHDVVGTKLDYNKEVNGEPLKHLLARQLSPDIHFEFEETIMQGKRVVLLSIPAAKNVPTSFANERYIRIGSSKENLRKYPERESFLFYVLRNGLPTIENTPSQYQNLTFEKLLVYYAAKGVKLNPDTFRKNLSFYTEEGQYNILAQLLSDDSHIPIRVAIFSGTTKADKMYSVREFGNQCLLYALDDVLRYGDVLNIVQADETNRVVERKEQLLFDDEIFREALINAFVHNKWVTGNEPMITVYSDRIEILSRGAIHPEQTMEGFFAGESIPVNKKLSEIFLQLHISEKTGRGVPRITGKYGKEAYEFRENSIVVKLPFKWINVMADKMNKKNTDEKQNVSSNMTDTSSLSANQVKILAEIRNNANITREQLAAHLGVGNSTIYEGLKALQNGGYIVRVGSKKTGYWQILK